MLFVPAAIDSLRGIAADVSISLNSILLNASLTLCLLTLFNAKLRRKFSILEQAFYSIDRPEDRPYTLVWLVTQAATAYVIMIVAVIMLPTQLIQPALFIPLSVIAFGDGLAEPVGIKFGKHQYRVRALFSKKTFVRSIEGSLCVYAASILAVIWFNSYFTAKEFIALLLILPILMTLTEAKSPHTWDTPFLLVTGIATISLINSIF